MRTVEDDVARTGATIAAVGTGDMAYARDFKATAEITFPLLVDDEHVSYRAVDAGRSSLAALARPAVVARGVRAVAQGARQGRVGTAPLLLGATHVIRPDGSIALAWRNADVADSAPVAAVLDALG